MINSINSNVYNTNLNKIINKINSDDKNITSSSDAFKDIFDAASKALIEVDDLQKASDTATLKFITGEDDNIHSVLLAQEKALIALQFTTEVANKSLEAYNEIMRMQI